MVQKIYASWVPGIIIPLEAWRERFAGAKNTPSTARLVPLPGYANRCASHQLLSDLRETFEYANSKVMAEVLRSIGADDVNSGFRCWSFPTLPVARRRFEMTYGGGDWAWKNDLTQWQGAQKIKSAAEVKKPLRVVEPQDDDFGEPPPSEPKISIAALPASPISSAKKPEVAVVPFKRRF